MRLIDADAFWESVSTDYWEHYTGCHSSDQIDLMEMIKDNLSEQPTIEARPVVRVEARPLEEWHEDYGDVLWWKFPIEEPPYVGSPLDCNWSGDHTHWTPIEAPEPPNCGADLRGVVE